MEVLTLFLLNKANRHLTCNAISITEESCNSLLLFLFLMLKIFEYHDKSKKLHKNGTGGGCRSGAVEPGDSSNRLREK